MSYFSKETLNNLRLQQGMSAHRRQRSLDITLASKLTLTQIRGDRFLILGAIYSIISRFQSIRLKTRFCYANDICIKAGLFHDKAGLLDNNAGVMENTLGVLKIIHGVLEKPLRA